METEGNYMRTSFVISSPNIIRVIENNKTMGHVVCMGEIVGACRDLVGISGRIISK
jgi:hypothetical protein